MKYAYVRCEVTKTRDAPCDLPSFAHCFVEAADDDQAYELGAKQLAAAQPLMPGYWLFNDYVVKLP